MKKQSPTRRPKAPDSAQPRRETSLSRRVLVGHFGALTAGTALLSQVPVEPVPKLDDGLRNVFVQDAVPLHNP
ncbi:MAG: hypothetical protein HZA90_04055 [Verrucomicrobia bacterium]|nr:hypothetical protein [Verrucomicrobiota bacterium]